MDKKNKKANLTRDIPDEGMDPLKSKLNVGLGQVENRKRAVDSQRMINQSRLEEVRRKMISDLFGLLEESGVDLTDLKSINRFLSQLQQTNPDMYELFENAFNGLMGEGVSDTLGLNNLQAPPQAGSMPGGMPQPMPGGMSPMGGPGQMSQMSGQPQPPEGQGMMDRLKGMMKNKILRK